MSFVVTLRACAFGLFSTCIAACAGEVPAGPITSGGSGGSGARMGDTVGGSVENGGSSPTFGGDRGLEQTGGTRASSGGEAPTGGLSSGGKLSAGGAASSSGGQAMSSGGGKSSGGGAGSGGNSGGVSATGGKSNGGAGMTSSGGTASGGSMSGAAGLNGNAGSSGDFNAGNPNGSCKSNLPARAQAADTSSPTSVVGDGKPDGCTFERLKAAIEQGGVITFDCGPNPLTIQVSATIQVPSNKNTVIDGGRKITLDGGKAVQILRFNSPDFRANDHGLTLQHIALVDGKQTPTVAIPEAPAPCSQGWNDGQGGALFMRDGYLNVIDCIFDGNQAAPLGPDTGGGAIYVLGSKAGVVIANSTFSNNAASNAGAVGALFAELGIYNSLFSHNTALGHDANNDDASKCDAINNDQHEVGSGGNGGAIYSDGNSVNVLLCGDAILDNAAGTKAFGGGLFFTSNDMGGTLTIADTTMSGNSGGHWTNVGEGDTMNAGSAVGTNTKRLTITNSKLQGL